MVIRFIFLLLTVMTVATNLSATIPLDWGDQGNGTYRNPVINADYSDPDVIRVGEKYYMVASDFHFMGMQILESLDMVNCSCGAVLSVRHHAGCARGKPCRRYPRKGMGLPTSPQPSGSAAGSTVLRASLPAS